MNTPIDLKQKSEFGSPITSPGMDVADSYPEFRVSGEDELGIPDEGTMTIKYRITREVSEKRGEKEHYSCTVEVQSIEKVSGQRNAPSKRDHSAEEALDILASKFKEKY